MVSIPISGYGFGNREYGEALTEALDELEPGVDYIARVEHVNPPNDWDEAEKEDFPINAMNLILRKKDETN